MLSPQLTLYLSRFLMEFLVLQKFVKKNILINITFYVLQSKSFLGGCETESQTRKAKSQTIGISRFSIVT